MGLGVGGNIGLSVGSSIAVVGNGIWDGDNDMDGWGEGDWGRKKGKVIDGVVAWVINAFVGVVVCGVIGAGVATVTLVNKGGMALRLLMMLLWFLLLLLEFLSMKKSEISIIVTASTKMMETHKMA